MALLITGGCCHNYTLQSHKLTEAVAQHAKVDWRDFLDVTSRRHEHKSRYPVKLEKPSHPILKGMPTDWITPRDELYVVEKMMPGVVSLASSKSEKNGKVHTVIWTHKYKKARVFGTTYGHSDETFKDPVFLNYVSRGLLWAAGKLNE